MKKILVSLVAMIFLFAPMALAVSFSGNYLGSWIGNDNASDILAEFELNLTKYDKIDLPATVSKLTDMTISSDDKWYSGTWSTAPTFVSYYSLKAGQVSSLYYLDPALSSGYWSTEHIVAFYADPDNKLTGGGKFGPALSHLTTWNSSTPPVQVPEPTTLILFGAGIAGLALYRRKRS